MATAKHADQLGKAIGVLEGLADSSPEDEAGTFSAAADVLRDYGRTLDADLDVQYRGNPEPAHLRAAIIVLTGRPMQWASPDATSVLGNAVDILEDRLEARSE